MNEAALLHLAASPRFFVVLSGGKDRLATTLVRFGDGAPRDRIELHNHDDLYPRMRFVPGATTIGSAHGGFKADHRKSG
ncbi:hypothetical protein SAMN05518849_11417 [Sphingobium sp. AP50]|nr:hypothetical protein SAMN05518849_11417 [Sphingobium sp. AP50]